MNCQQSNSLNLSLSGTGRPRNATLTPQGSPDRKVAKSHASSIGNASSFRMSSMQVSRLVGNALFVSHEKPVQEVQQMLKKIDDLKGITLTANPTKLSNPSTFNGAHCNQGFMNQLKAVQDQNLKIEADKEAKK